MVKQQFGFRENLSTEDAIYLFIYLHSIDPYMVGTPVDIEIVGGKSTNHITCIDKLDNIHINKHTSDQQQTNLQ